MIPMKIGISYEGAVAALVSDETGDLPGKSLLASGRYWHGQMLPDHFANNAVGRYGYQKRTAAYQRRKAREKHHQRPMVWSGSLAGEATRRAIVRRNKRGEVSVAFYGRAFNLSGKSTKTGARYPNLRAEATAVTSAEMKTLSQVSADALKSLLRHHRRRVRKTL